VPQRIIEAARILRTQADRLRDIGIPETPLSLQLMKMVRELDDEADKLEASARTTP
jgi:hypothetical protein